jgi:TonB family protein
LLLAQAAASIAIAEPAEPKLLNLPEVMTSQDYPRVSIQHEEEGTVLIRLRIDESGLVTSCKIVKSSGHAALDEQTCALYRARARFEPAKDRLGRVIASNSMQKITWRLEGNSATPTPRQAWMRRTTAALSGNGRLVDCEVESVGIGAQDTDECDVLRSLVGELNADTPGTSDVALFSISEVYFYPTDPAKLTAEPKLDGATEVARQVSRLVISPEGEMIGCEAVRYSGGASPQMDVCDMMRSSRFEPAKPGSGNLVATLIMVAYRRPHRVA